MSRGGARAGANRTSSPEDSRQAQGMRGSDPSRPDIVTPETALELELALIRALLERRLVGAVDSARRQHLELFERAGRTVDPDRRSPVSSGGGS